MLQTEYEFTLPIGFQDEDGSLHRDGTMRLATAADEILPLKDARVQNNPAYLSVIVLSRVVSRLGSVPHVTPKVIEGLYAADMAYLQTLYNKLNDVDAQGHQVCPNCSHIYAAEHASGGIAGYPLGQLYEEVAFLAYHFHWPLDQLVSLEHAERRKWVGEVSRMNEQANSEMRGSFELS